MSVGAVDRLSSEAARRRLQLREEQDRHEVTRKVLRDTNRQLLSVYLRERMHAPVDFEVYVGLDEVLDVDGRLVWERVDVLLGELLDARPHLAIGRGVGTRERPTSAVVWLSTGS
jgi:hypothetical protein